jgi:MATE family, multidrug efflux pump
VGRLGKEAIAAVGLAGNLTIIVLALTQMLGVGTTALISQAAGQKDQPRAELVFNQSFVMSILIAIGLGIVGFLLRTPYCDALSAGATTAALAKGYLFWFIPGMLLQFPLVTLGSALRDRNRETGGGVAGLECGAQHGARTVTHLRSGGFAKARSNGRGPGDLYLHSDRRCLDGDLFREEVSLSAVSGGAMAATNQDMVGNVANRLTGRRRVCLALSLHRHRLRNHPRLWAGGASRLWDWRACDAGALSSGGGTGLRGKSGGRTKLRRVRQSVYAAIGLASAIMLVLALVVHYLPAMLIRGFSKDPHVIAFGSEYFRIVVEFRGGGNCLLQLERFSRNWQYDATSAELYDAAGLVCLAVADSLAPRGV